MLLLSVKKKKILPNFNFEQVDSMHEYVPKELCNKYKMCFSKAYKYKKCC